MREILFRGKDKLGHWLYGGFHLWETRQPCVIGDELKPEEIKHIIIKNSFADWNMPREMQPYEVIPETVGQYTGLTDKNGTKIFEGDILKVDVYEYETETCSFNVFGETVGNKYKKQTGRKIKALWSIEYKEHYCRGNGFYAYGKDRRFNVSLTKSTLFNANAEVIGNIHDNPELLKEREG